MKKLLVLALVLGIVSLASAGISIRSDKTELVESETALITVGCDTPLLGGYSGQIQIVIEPPAPGEWTGAYTVGENAPHGPTYEVTYYGKGDGIDMWFVDLTTPSTTPVPAMDYISFVFHCTGFGPVDIQVTDMDGIVLDTVTIIQTPEPMTMLLLGLGGLFLRKR